jgi:iron complex transport system substrate-binding protein
LPSRKVVVIAIVLFAFAGSWLGKRILYGPEPAGTGVPVPAGPRIPVQGACGRIVSLAPSITEILFMLGLGDRVAGVTRYCNFPPAARTRPRIGGYDDPSYEAVVALNPDLVVLLPEHEAAGENLGKLGFPLLVVDHRSISGILNSMETIGKACGVERKAMSVTRELRERMERIRRATEGLPRPRVLLSVGRNMGSGSLEDVYVSGRTVFYDEMISLAGGINAYRGDIAFPVLSREGMIRMNPGVIIDMIPDFDEKGLARAAILREWETVSPVDAVKNGRVYVFGEDYVAVPGPRFILIAEKMARAIHPEAAWE